MRKLRFLLACLAFGLSCYAQDNTITMKTPDAVVTNSFWDNWYGQVGVDMHLQFPKGHNMMDVFPNGKSFGVDVAVGKWFSPEFGGRFKVKWNNGILKNGHNTWLRPYGVPGGNHDEGGFITFIGDIQINLNNLFGRYKHYRRWNLIASPRFGGWYDIGNGEGSPVLGVGIVNTYRLSDRWRLFADLGYFFVGSLNGVSSGKGHGSNGYGEVNVGVEMDLSRQNKFYRVSNLYNKNTDDVALNPFWDNWFVQAGLGMSLMNPYDTDFKHVFPNGKTFGINLGIGKWFTPEAGVRGGLNWQNGIIGNGYASYLDRTGEPGSNKDKHGFIALYADMLFNLHNIIGGYHQTRKWNAIVFPRMGIAQNFSSDYKENPVVGIGTEQTYRLNGRWSLYCDLTYQVTTSGFLDKKFPTGTGARANGWFDLNVGIQYDLNQNIWYKSYEQPSEQQILYEHNWPRFMVNTIASVGVGFGVKTVLKKVIKEERPDGSDKQSFPSGHATMAFAAARSIDKEFRKDCIWIPLASYAAATAIGVERVVNDKHHWYDVLAGAAIGVGSAELTWWLSDLLIPNRKEQVAVGFSGNKIDVAISW